MEACAPILALLDIGGPELMVILVVALLLFGGKRMPEVAKGLGKAIREFKKATSGVEEEIRKALAEEPAPAKPKAAPAAPSEPSAPPAAAPVPLDQRHGDSLPPPPASNG